MLQRVQTIYLFLVIACVVTIIFFPIYTFTITGDFNTVIAEFNKFGMQTINITEPSNNGFLPFYLLYVFIALFALRGILLFNNRKKQIRVIRVGFIVNSIVAGFYLIYPMVKKSSIETLFKEKALVIEKIEVGHGVGYYLMFASLAFFLLAIRGVKADEKLVKSLDRLR